MSAIGVASFAFGGCLAAGVLGLLLHKALPPSHLSSESKDVMKLVLGLIATISALVLGLLIASAKSTYDTQRAELQQLAASIVELDQALAAYGQETQPVRQQFRRVVERQLDVIWPEHGPVNIEPMRITPASVSFLSGLEQLHPATGIQQLMH